MSRHRFEARPRQPSSCLHCPGAPEDPMHQTGPKVRGDESHIGQLEILPASSNMAFVGHRR